jgi:polysaccharide export outer membrane protein
MRRPQQAESLTAGRKSSAHRVAVPGQPFAACGACAMPGVPAALLGLAVFVALGPLVAFGCGPHRPSGPEPQLPASAIADTTLGPDDVFEIRVFNEKEMTNTYRVDADGTIDFPLAGRLAVQGLTPGQTAKLIGDRLRDGFLRDPQVSVLVKEYNSKKIAVLGQVQKPGTFNHVPSMSIIEAIALAGGFTPLAAKNDITVRRLVGNRKQSTRVRVEDIALGRSPSFMLRPGDTVFVPERIF